MDPAWNAFTGLFEDGAQLAVERALAELRAGRPILLEGAQGRAMVAAIDALSASAFAAIAGYPEIKLELALSRARARAIGLAVDGAVSLPVGGLDHETVCRLAAGTDAELPARWSPAEAMALMGMELCKQALLLPAVLIAEVAGSVAVPIHRLSLAEAQASLGQNRVNLEIVSRARIPLAGDIEASLDVIVCFLEGERRGLAAKRDPLLQLTHIGLI